MIITVHTLVLGSVNLRRTARPGGQYHAEHEGPRHCSQGLRRCEFSNCYLGRLVSEKDTAFNGCLSSPQSDFLPIVFALIWFPVMAASQGKGSVWYKYTTYHRDRGKNEVGTVYSGTPCEVVRKRSTTPSEVEVIHRSLDVEMVVFWSLGGAGDVG